MNQAGRVIAAFGRHYTVVLDDGTQLQAYPKGKRGQAVVGDNVTVARLGNEGSIQAIAERRNLLYRSDAMRSKQFAANIDQILVVVAPEPPFSDDLLGRTLTAAGAAGIPAHILLNKCDLPERLVGPARARLAPLAALGVPVHEVAALQTDALCATLRPLLQGKTSLLLGQSAMGKSTVLNALVPDAAAATQAHSEALGAGRHTTTTTRLYSLPDNGGDIIDSPGFQNFGLLHLSATEVERGFPEFAPYADQCRFYNCTHRHEPGCAVLVALDAGDILAERHALYLRILDENSTGTSY